MRWLTTSGLLRLVCLTKLASSGIGQIDIVCDALEGNQIDWECVFGPGSLAEVHTRGGEFTTCPSAVNSRHPCSRFIVPKEGERSEVKIKAGPEGFPFKKNERYIFRYSFRPKDGMQVGKQYTHFGQLKGDESYDGTSIIYGVPIFSLTANLDGLMVRFSNLETISNFHRGLETFLPWSNTLGQWVHVKIVTVLGVSMRVDISGAVEGSAVWPEHLTPIGWHNDAKMARLKLGLYHKTGEVADGEVEYRNIQIRGPNGRIRSSPKAEPSGTLYRGCFEDVVNDRVLSNKKFVDAHMTNEMCEELCEGYEYFGTQFSTECFCGDASSRLFKHGRSNSCTRDCGGNSRINKCGGWLAISIFQYEGSPADIPEDTDYVGCFADDQNDRALALKQTVNNAMTYERCRATCDAVDARYFGVQYSKECFCGSASADYDQHGNAICHMSCSGNSDVICGGFNAMSVFRIT